MINVAGEDLFRHPVIHVAVCVRHLKVSLENVPAPADIHEFGEVFEVLPYRVRPRTRDRFFSRIGQEYGPRHSPVGSVRLSSRSTALFS